MKCPICGSELSIAYTDYIDYIKTESEYVCPHGHYSELFITGYSAVSIYNSDWLLPCSYHTGYTPGRYEKIKYAVLLFVARLRWRLT